MCAKEQYPNETEAREASKGMSRDYGTSMQHYFCKDCSVWHVRTRGKKPRNHGKRNNNKYPFRYQPVKRIENNKKRKK
jgi:hypothetical protein